MKYLLFYIALMITSVGYAKEVEVPLTSSEIVSALDMVNSRDKYEIEIVISGPCSVASFKVGYRAKRFNPASWFLIASAGVQGLDLKDISSMKKIFERLNIPYFDVDPNTREAIVEIRGQSCGLTPDRWTATFDNLI